jgi:hypothetical protein
VFVCANICIPKLIYQTQGNTMQTKYIIQFDRKGKYGIRVCTMSGFAMGYFMHMNDAIAWCEAN